MDALIAVLAVSVLINVWLGYELYKQANQLKDTTKKLQRHSMHYERTQRKRRKERIELIKLRRLKIRIEQLAKQVKQRA